MKYTQTILAILILISCQSSKDELEMSRDYKSPKDSLNGTYIEIMAVKGVPVSEKYYEKYKLIGKATYENGYINDMMALDSLGNVTYHRPILVWINPDRLANLDTLKFEIRLLTH